MKIFSKAGDVSVLEAEHKGLVTLGCEPGVRVPRFLNLKDGCLEMEQIGPAIDSPNWDEAGRMLANLHAHTHSQYGMDYDNYIGPLPQSNDTSDNWDQFWIQKRIRPQWMMAKEKGFDLGDFESGYWMEVSRSIVKNRRPCLIHGDLWSGNLLFDRSGDPVFIDPSVYIGVGGVDISMSRLFGGFPPSFYEAYSKHSGDAFPSNEEILWYQLYYVLVHVNMFGSSYYTQATRMIRQIRTWLK